MRKSKDRIYIVLTIIITAIFFTISFTVFSEPNNMVKEIYKEHRAFSIFTMICIVIIMNLSSKMSFEWGRTDGIKELAKKAHIKLEEWPEKIVVCEKHTFTNE